VINATPQKRCLAYKKSPEERKMPPFSLGWLNVLNSNHKYNFPFCLSEITMPNLHKAKAFDVRLLRIF